MLAPEPQLRILISIMMAPGQDRSSVMSSTLVKDLLHQREDLIAEIRRRNIRDERILQALRQVPREEFVSPELRYKAYEDSPLPIAQGQTISQPYIVAFMIELAGLQPLSRVLEIGTGSGYAAAVIAQIAARVFTIERQQYLFENSRARLEELGYQNIATRLGDGTEGWPEEAPFDAIIVSAGSSHIPRQLLSQLKTGGKLIIPIGRHNTQKLLRIVRSGADRYESKDFGPVSFVELVSAR
jgi:protein-L-isoaspartate(D-aspartate) O-methyltransferase